MKKIICLLIAVMLVVSVAAVSFGAAGSVSVTVVGLDGVSQTKTYNVGDTFKVYTTMKSSENDGKIACFKGEQTYTSGVLEVANETDGDGLITTDVAEVFPITNDSSSIANAGYEGVVHFSASTPSMKKPYVFDSDNCKLIVLTYKVVAEGSAEIKTTLTTLATSDMNLTKLISKGAVTDPSYEITVHSSLNDPDATGFTVSGAITSYLSDSDVTVKLEGVDNDFTATVTGKDSYAIENVPNGEYKLSVEKKDHVAREYAVTVDGADVTQDVKICPIGDANNDGKVNAKDSNAIMRHISKASILTDYNLLCANANGDTKVNAKDVNRILRHLSKAEPLF